MKNNKYDKLQLSGEELREVVGGNNVINIPNSVALRGFWYYHYCLLVEYAML